MINQISHSLLRAEDLKRVLEYRGPPELKGWGQAAHILLQYERSYDSFLAIPSWNEPLESDCRSAWRKVPAIKTPKPSSQGNTFSAQSSASQYSSDLSFPAE